MERAAGGVDSPRGAGLVSPRGAGLEGSIIEELELMAGANVQSANAARPSSAPSEQFARHTQPTCMERPLDSQSMFPQYAQGLAQHPFAGHVCPTPPLQLSCIVRR
jgi:hypothetical protein